jgi:hypothetical protein
MIQKRKLALCLALAALAGCGVSDQPAAGAPTSQPPTPTAYQRPTAVTIPSLAATVPEPSSPVEVPVTAEPQPILPEFDPLAPTPYANPEDQPTPTAVPLPEPALPLDQALQQLSGNVLLYMNLNKFFMLNNGRRELWLTVDSAGCAMSKPSGRWWSADGRFIAITRDCRYLDDTKSLLTGFSGVALWDAQTGEFHQLGAGQGEVQDHFKYAAGRGWSPAAPRFLISFSEATAVSDTTTRVRTRWSVVDAPTRATTTLMEVEDDSQPSAAAWSPDGATIAILAYGLSDRQFGLYLIGADGSNLRRLAQVGDGVTFSSAAWSPDGRSIYLSRYLDATVTYQTLQVSAGDGALSIVADNQVVPTEFRWSPDGQWYLTSEMSAGDTWQRWSLHRADGALEHWLEGGPVNMLADAAWLPDSGRMIIVVRHFTKQGEFLSDEVIIRDVVGVERVIARYTGSTSPSVAAAPDGTLLALNTGSHIEILDLEGQKQAVFDGWGFEWRPRP